MQTTIATAMIAELEQEAVATRRLLEVIPEDKFDWRPHPKGKSLGELAMHLAGTQGGVAKFASADVGEPDFPPDPVPNGRAEIQRAFEESLRTAKEIVGATDDARAMEIFTVKINGKVVMAVPRASIWRMIMLNHFYHHRGQLSTYLRALDVRLPSIYGPTADSEMM